LGLDLKKIYYYIIALASALILFWGVIDLASASIGLATGKFFAAPSLPDKSSDSGLDEYYQRKAAEDRLIDSLSRIIVSGIVFAYVRSKIERLERS